MTKLRPSSCPSTLRGVGIAAFAGFAFGLPGVGHAAPLAERMRASANTQGYLATESSQVLPALATSTALLTGWGRFGGDRKATDRWSIDDRTTSNLVFGMGILGLAQVDLDLPLIVYQRGSSLNTSQTLRPSAFGDLRTSIKGTILHARRRGLGLGAGLDLFWPTGSSTALAGMGTFTAGFSLMAEYRAFRGFRGALNLGYLARPRRDGSRDAMDDLVTYRLAGRAPFGPHTQYAAIVELDGGIHLHPEARSPLVARAGLDWTFASGMQLGLFAGGGLSARLGTPQVQALIRVSFIPPGRLRKERAFVGSHAPSALSMVRSHDQMRRTPRATSTIVATKDDPDADGLSSATDLCPNVPEDLDRFADEDGCPEPDNDRDSLADNMDLCPNEPEITNGFADLDGCPDYFEQGVGKTVATLKEAQLFPEIAWVGPSDRLTRASQAAFVRFTETLLLNPWLSQVEIKLQAPNSQSLANYAHIDPQEIAKRRVAALLALVDASALDSWRVQISTAPGQARNTVFVLHGVDQTQRLAGLAPVAADTQRLESHFVPKAQTYAAQGPQTTNCSDPQAASCEDSSAPTAPKQEPEPAGSSPAPQSPQASPH